MKKNLSRLSIITILIVLFISLVQSPKSQAVMNYQSSTSDTTLLKNGNFDTGFYFRPLKDYVAVEWYQWWATNFAIPEYIDGGHPYHNQCYPNIPGPYCHNDNTQTYNSSQGYIRWGEQYIAGIYQPVHNVVPCTLYTFEIWNRNDADASIYHPKIGIDPTGWVITRLGNSPPENCPPDGTSQCPDPYIGDDHDFPATMVWSDLTQGAYTWGLGSMTVEARNTSISVWTYAAPDNTQVSMSTYWDYASLVQTPFPDDKLPDPDSWNPSGFIYNVTSVVNGSRLIIEWDTLEPASTQITYTITHETPPVTGELSHITYLPTVNNYQPGRPSTLDTTPVTHHVVVLNKLLDGDTVTYIPMSRRPVLDACRTEVGLQYIVNID